MHRSIFEHIHWGLDVEDKMKDEIPVPSKTLRGSWSKAQYERLRMEKKGSMTNFPWQAKASVKT